MSKEKQKAYIDEIVADIKREQKNEIKPMTQKEMNKMLGQMHDERKQRARAKIPLPAVKKMKPPPESDYKPINIKNMTQAEMKKMLAQMHGESKKDKEIMVMKDKIFNDAAGKINKKNPLHTRDFMIEYGIVPGKYTVLNKIYDIPNSKIPRIEIWEENLSKKQLIKWMRENIMEHELEDSMNPFPEQKFNTPKTRPQIRMPDDNLINKPVRRLRKISI